MSETIEQKIESKTDVALAGSTEVSSTVGGLSFRDMSQVMEFSKLMAVSKQAVPGHLRGQPGMCLAITLQALNWRMDPFSVANKSYSVNDRVAYEAQLVQAVIEQRAPIKGRLKGRFEGEGENRICILTAIDAEDGETIEYRSPPIGQIKVKNSPLWKADPDQQLWYYSARAMCRRHFPDVLLGVYEKEELRAEMRDVTPTESHARGEQTLAQRLAAAKAEATPEPPDEPVEAEVIPDAETVDDVLTADPDAFEYAEGKTAGSSGVSFKDCPYDEGSQQQADWQGGWIVGEKEQTNE